METSLFNVGLSRVAFLIMVNLETQAKKCGRNRPSHPEIDSHFPTPPRCCSPRHCGYFLLVTSTSLPDSQLPGVHPTNEGGAVSATHNAEIQHYASRGLGGSLQQQGYTGEWAGGGQVGGARVGGGGA